MSWPTSPQYYEAVQGLRSSMSDEELRGGEVAYTPLGLPMLWSGNFADVYKIHCPKSGNTWALKCFTRGVRGLQERYRIIAAHLEQAGLPFTVEFQYLEQGIRIAGDWFPALKMRWVEGLTLSDFVEEHLDRPKNLKMLLDLWPKLAARLREAGIAHADLQHGNVLLVPQQRGALALRLIDYDGMYVPGLAGTRSGELGHPAYQHPQRFRDGTYSAEVDRFSHLAIYTAVHCLTIGRRQLWRQLNNGDNLLFRESDYARPAQSEAFRTLWAHGDAGIRALVGRLVLACQWPLERAPLLDEVLLDGKIIALSRRERSAVDEALSAEEAPLLAEPVAEAAALPVAILAEPTEPAPRAAALLRRAVRSFSAAVRWPDRLLARLVGEENAILHNFLRGVAAVVLLLFLVVTAKFAPPLLGSLFSAAVEQWASKTDGEGGEPPAPVRLRLPPPTAQTIEAGKQSRRVRETHQ